MVWKVINVADTGTASKFGGNDFDKVNNAFNGTNVGDAIIYNTDFNTLKDSTTNAAGDILKGNGTKYVRFARGTANQVLAVNSGGTDLQWTTPAAASGGFDPTVAQTVWRISVAGAQGFEIGPNVVTPANCYIDFHNYNGDGDYASRIIRQTGSTGDLDIINTGTGDIDLNNGMLTVGSSTAGADGVFVTLPSVDTSAESTKNFKLSQTVTATATTAIDYKPIDITLSYEGTNVTDRHDLADAGMHLKRNYGSDSVDAKGTCHAFTIATDIKGSDNYDNEVGSCVIFMATDTEPASMWCTDFNLHGPVNVQPGMLIGLSQFINNYYNGSPTRNTSAGLGIYTKYNGGGGSQSGHVNATTYPIDLGLIICGTSGNSGSSTGGIGYTTGIQVGGFGGSWQTSGFSRVGTGLKIFDCYTNAIDLSTQVPSDLSGYCIKLPVDGHIAVSGGAKLSWDGSDNLTLRSAGTAGIKTIGAAVGNTDSVHYLAGHRPDIRKYGSWQGAQTFAAGGDGVLSDRLTGIVVGTGTTGSAAVDSTGVYRTADTGATTNSLSGVQSGTNWGTRINNAYFKAKIRTDPTSIANTRIYCGLVATGSAPTSQADPLNALAGVALWYDSAVNANWRRLHNDSSGASVSDDTSVAVATATEYVVEIEAVTDSKFVFRFNGTSTDITTDIPGSTTTLGFWVYIENTTGASRTLRDYYMIIRTDK